MNGMDQMMPGTPPLPTLVKDEVFLEVPQGLVNTLYQDCEFTNVNWSGISLVDVRFINCKFTANVFSDCTISNVVCSGGSMHGIEWVGCAFDMVVLSAVSLQQVCWKLGELRHLTCENVRGENCGFEDVRSAHASFIECELAGVRLRGGSWADTSLIGGALNDCGMESVSLERFVTAQSKLHQWEMNGCRGTNVRWMSCSIDSLSMRDCQLSPAAWGESKWSNGRIESCHLPMAHFGAAMLANLVFVNTAMNHALFDKAQLMDCDMRGMQAPGASLRSAKLERVNLASARMQGLDASNAVLRQVELAGADCTGARLIGQSRSDWRSARTDQAAFEELQRHNDTKNYDDTLWWKHVQPGARGIFS